MNATETYEALENLVGGSLTYYREDLTKIDRELIHKFPGIPFIHVTRKSGTHIFPMLPPNHEEWPEGNAKKKPYLFGALNRKDTLRSESRSLGYVCKGEHSKISFFDGKTVKLITKNQAIVKFEIYVNNTIAEWKKGESR